MASTSVVDRFKAVKAASGIKRNKFTPTSAGPHVFQIDKFKTTTGNKVNGAYWIFEVTVARSPGGKDNGQKLDIMIEQETMNGKTQEQVEENRDRDATKFKGYCASALGLDSYNEELVNGVMGSDDFYKAICEEGILDGAFIGGNVVKKHATKPGAGRKAEPVLQYEKDAQGNDVPVYWTNIYPLDLRIEEGWSVNPDDFGQAINEAGETCPRLDVTLTGR